MRNWAADGGTKAELGGINKTTSLRHVPQRCFFVSLFHSLKIETPVGPFPAFGVLVEEAEGLRISTRLGAEVPEGCRDAPFWNEISVDEKDRKGILPSPKSYKKDQEVLQ